MDLAQFWTAEYLYLVVLWFAVGLLVGWTRGLGLSVLLPLIVSAGPVVFGLQAGTGIELFPGGADIPLLFRGILFPLGASVAGAHAALAVNPRGHAKATARRAYERARAEADRIAAEVHAVELAFADAYRAAATQGSAPTDEVTVLRAQLARRQNELRQLGRSLAESA